MERRTIRGVHFLKVAGTNAERARAHAALLRDEVHEGPLYALAKKNEWLIRRGPGLLQHSRFLQDQVVALYKKLFVPLLDRTTDEYSREWARAMADVAGVPYLVCREALFQAEALMFLSRVSIFKHLREAGQGAFSRVGMPGCSSAVLARGWTRSGKLLACRNFDYPVVGPWERHPVVAFNEPSEKGQIPHLAVSAAGLSTGGITSMNREGLTLSTHAHFGSKVSLNGRPIVSIGDEIIRSARTIGEAVDIARKRRRYAYWAFVISSGKENDAVVLELSPDKTCVRHPEDGYIAHTNYFHSPELVEEEGLLSGGCFDDLYSRFCRMREILEPLRGRIEPEHLAGALGDHVDPFTGEERVFGNTMSVVTTVNSVIFDPENQRLWMTTRNESPTGLGPFIEVSADTFWSERAEGSEPRLLEGCKPGKEGLSEALHHYRSAYIAWHMDNHEPDYAERALAELRRAVRAYPADGNLWIQAGTVAFFLRLFEEAFAYFQEARKRKLSDHVERVRDLYLARCHDLRGEREEALCLYRTYLKVSEPKLRRALKAGLRRKYDPKRAGLLIIDLQFPDTFQY